MFQILAVTLIAAALMAFLFFVVPTLTQKPHV